MTRVLLDQGLAPRAARLLTEHGFDAIHVSDIGMAEADDAEILDRARADGLVCVTLDHDFHSHLAMTRAGRPSVVLLRVERMDAQAQADLILAVLQSCEGSLETGCAVSADGESIRVRKLPLK